jgi:hypothetical protein
VPGGVQPVGAPLLPNGDGTSEPAPNLDGPEG